MNKHLEWLGYEVRDRVSGMSGTVTSICFDLYGCVQADVRPKFDAKKNEMPTGIWLDVTRLEKLSKRRVMEIPDGAAFALEQPHGPSQKSPRA